MKSMFSELLKYKRTFTAKLIIFIPVFFAVYSIVINYIIENNAQAASNASAASSWNVFLALVFNWWSFLFLPLGMGLFAGLVAMQEKKAGNYRVQRSHDIAPFKIWRNKVFGMAVISFMSSIVLILSIIVSGLLTEKGAMPLKQIITAGLLCWLVSLVLIPIQLWIATMCDFLLSMGVGFLGTVLGVILAPTSYWIVCPWSYATRLMCPVIGVHPNGVVLDSSNPLLDTSVIPLGIIVSIVVLALAVCLTGFWFSRKEL